MKGMPLKGFPGGSVVKNPLANAGLIPGSGRISGEENGNPLKYSCLGNPMGRGAGYSPWGHKRVSHDLTKQKHSV